ncbi:MAG: site-specific DNA-methyltransferase [Pseudomonadota bacterium]
MALIEKHHGDCLEVMASLPAASIDAVVTDPPYGQTSLPWDKWQGEWIKEVNRVLKPSGSMWVFGTLRMFLDRVSDFDGWSMAQDIVWEKHNGSSFHTDRFRRVHEQAVQFYRGQWADVYKGKVVTMDAVKKTVRRKAKPPHWHGETGATDYVSEDGGPRLQRSVIFARSMHGKALHPTQKPEAILEPLILNSCPSGGVVLDPFAGSGSTGFVAQRLDRDAILIEANETYFNVIQDRFSSDLFGAA